MRGFSKFIAVALLSLSVAALPVFAIGPAGQTITPQRGAEVRILYGDATGVNGTFGGSGFIIANKKVTLQNGTDEGFYCVVTSDHVVSPNGTLAGVGTLPNIGIAFNNSPVTTLNNQGPYLRGTGIRSTNIFGAATKVDLALVWVDYGLYSQINDLFVRNMVSDSTAAKAFSVIGYGNQGNLVAGTGFKSTGNYGTQRYANSKADAYLNAFAGPVGYVFDAVRDLVPNPNAVGATAGAGTIFDGDSGSPWLTSIVAQQAGQNIDYFTQDAFAVTESGVTRDTVPADGTYFRDFGAAGYGVHLAGTTGTADGKTYRENLTNACMMLPEPTAILLILPWGLVLLAARCRFAV